MAEFPYPAGRVCGSQRSGSAVDRMEAFFPRSGFGQGAPEGAREAAALRAVLDEIRSVGTTLRHTIDGEVAFGG